MSVWSRIEAVKRTLAGRVKRKQQYVNVFSSPEGQDVLRHICKAGYVFESTFVRGDVNETMLNEGSRRLALSILRQVCKDDSKLIKQIEQELEKQNENAEHD